MRHGRMFRFARAMLFLRPSTGEADEVIQLIPDEEETLQLGEKEIGKRGVRAK